jgi:hypothetical protein
MRLETTQRLNDGVQGRSKEWSWKLAKIVPDDPQAGEVENPREIDRRVISLVQCHEQSDQWEKVLSNRDTPESSYVMVALILEGVPVAESKACAYAVLAVR